MYIAFYTNRYLWHIKVSSNVLTFTEKLLKNQHKFEIHIWKKKLWKIVMFYVWVSWSKCSRRAIQWPFNLSVVAIYCQTFRVIVKPPPTFTFQLDFAAWHCGLHVLVGKCFPRVFLHLLIIHVLFIMCVYEFYRNCTNRETKCELRLLKLVSFNIWQYRFNR